MDSPRFNPLKVLRWHDRITDAIAGRPTGLIRANIDLTNLCSHSCGWCEPIDFRKQTITDKRHTLPLEKVVEICEDLRALNCKMVVFSGGGEPTLHPDFGSCVASAKSRGMKTGVITHGGYISKWHSSFLQFVDFVRISLDASTPHEHELIHGAKRGEFHHIIEAVKQITDHPKVRRPEISLAYTVEHRNCDEGSILEFLEIAAVSRVDSIQVRPCSDANFVFANEWERAAIFVAKNAKKVCPQVNVILAPARSKDVHEQRNFKRCYSAVTIAVIGANGDLSACCDERGIVFGNIYQNRLKNIWMSPEHIKKAKEIVPQFCERCLQSGYNEAVERFVVNDEAMSAFI